MLLQSFAIVLFTLALLALLSLRAAMRFQAFDRLPMHWGLDGKVNSTAPRAFALSFTPVLAVIVLLPAAVLPGNAGRAPLPVLFLAVTFIAVHLLHLSLIAKSLKL